MKLLEWFLDHPLLRPISRLLFRIVPRDIFIQFFKFGMVGVIGLFVDIGVLNFCMSVFGMGPYSGRLISFLMGASTTWICNRVFTFRGQGSGPAHVQWAKFVAVCVVGFAFNYGAYAVVISTIPFAYVHPWIGVAAGSIAGMFFNFYGARRMVFR
jgi:putative flippase GtrA